MSDLKLQRDRFLAFAFASADLFAEVSETGEIIFALGAAKGLTGIKDSELLGKQWLDVFSASDRGLLRGLRAKAVPGMRAGPLPVTMDEKLCGGAKAIVTGLKMPDTQSFYLTVGFTNDLMQKVAGALRENMAADLLDKDSFIRAATGVVEMTRSLGGDLQMTLLDIADAAKIKSKVGDAVWERFHDAVTEFLLSSSADGRAAGKIAEGRYSIVHDNSVASDGLRAKLQDISKEADPEGKGFRITSKNITADVDSLSEREAMKALVYTINEFERKGTALSIESLNSSIKVYAAANAQKIKEFKSIIERLDFDFHYQPIVDFVKKDVSHFEMLSRFKAGGSTQEWVIFGEDVGLAADFDIAVCERAINYLLYKGGVTRKKFAVNLSGQSMQNEMFFKTLLAKLTANKGLSERIIFEITESTQITQLELVNKFIKTMQGHGFKVCLDDFGAGAASFQYLQKLQVDYVKIDGQYTRRLLESPRDGILIKNLNKMCEELGVLVIVEQVELKEQYDMLRDLGIKYGQGYYFGHPQSRPDYDPSQFPAT